MLEHNFQVIGDRFWGIRKKRGLTQSEVADAAGLSDRTYADIERGTVNMRLGTFLRICDVLHVTPNEILLPAQDDTPLQQNELIASLASCSEKEKATALRILDIYIKSLS